MLTTAVNEQHKTSRSFSLSTNYLNPFNSQMKISFSVPSESHITLKIYNLLGREATTIVLEK